MTITPGDKGKGPASGGGGAAGRDMGAIRNAYKSGDAGAMRTAHEKTPLIAVEKHGGQATEYVKSIVFGGLDGILTTFAIVTAAAGAEGRISPAAVLIFGFANLIADGFGMGFGEYTSSKAEQDFAVEERRREEWELETHPEGERQEMVELYMQKGITEKDASAMMDILMKYPKVFVDMMMVDELGLQADDVDDWGPAKQGLIMFLSFIAFGAVPLLAYLPFLGAAFGFLSSFALSCVLTGVCLCVLGFFKGLLIKTGAMRSALQMLLNGFCAAAASYSISAIIAHLITPAPLDTHPSSGVPAHGHRH